MRPTLCITFRAIRNIVTYEGRKIIPKESGISFDLFLCMKLPMHELLPQGIKLYFAPFIEWSIKSRKYRPAVLGGAG